MDAALTLPGTEWTPVIENEFKKIIDEAVGNRHLCHRGSQRYMRRSLVAKVTITVVSSTLTLLSTATTTSPRLSQSSTVLGFQLLLSGLLTILTAVVALLAYDRRAEQLRKLAVEWGSLMSRAQYIYRCDDERRRHARVTLGAMWEERNGIVDSDVFISALARNSSQVTIEPRALMRRHSTPPEKLDDP